VQASLSKASICLLANTVLLLLLLLLLFLLLLLLLLLLLRLSPAGVLQCGHVRLSGQ
jgi:hypothetical protein